MLKVRVNLVFFYKDEVLFDAGELPNFLLFKNDNIRNRVFNFIKHYFNYADNWIDINLSEPEIIGDELNLYYGVLVGKDNKKGKWENVKSFGNQKESIQRAIYNASKII